MVKLSSRTLALVIEAIKNMRESKGSTSRDILHYVSSVYNIPYDVAKRQIIAALKRGIAHGILRKSDGYYSLPIDTESECMEVAAQELGLLDFCCRRKKREQRKRKGCKKMSKSRRKKSRKSRGCKTKGRRSRSGKKRRGKSRSGESGCGCAPKSRKARSSRRGRSGKGCVMKRRPKKCKDEPTERAYNKSDYPKNETVLNDEKTFSDRRASRCRSQNRSRSCSRNRNLPPTT